jgi:hypothetical protein
MEITEFDIPLLIYPDKPNRINRLNLIKGVITAL